MTARGKIQSTKIVERQGGYVVEMILSSASDVEASPEVIQIRVTLDTDDQYPPLQKLQEVALDRVRDVLDHEIQRLRSAEVKTARKSR